MAYSKEQIENDRKHYLKELIENANQLVKDTQGTEICWQISSVYDFDKWDKNILDITSQVA